ncbi:FAD-dependent oxidoreductase [Streptomyces mirabilis]|uniref:NADPH-dependent 2,4-dienoyl-CoA reductase, sulfur reductase n=1 Tax=Streptomyces mirabilis TaxID=68239 RepID=A0A1I2X2A1_9ACTN|nr:FAD-dependent oxidoreductase [Streptomyces mirabilis]SFH07562.1 NADPH-dependent 2,4-dienoyl-CoA reductase, sulfur reductase [Streptomyces mirabilis]
MKVVVDLTRCQGYAQCAFAAPDVFVIHGDEALLYDTDPDDAQREKIVRAAAACPVQAIFLDRDDTRIREPAPETHVAETHVAAPDPGEAFKRTGRIVIVGASLAGLRAGRMLRQEGFTGSLTVIGDEPHAPYDRPPLSKQVLLGQVPARRTGLPRRDELDAHWRFGVAATGLDLSGKQVLLADGAKVGFDRLLIATGVRARLWPNEAEAALDGLFALRTPEDAEGLRQRLAAGPGRVLVIGAGFTGCEVASACRELDLQVTVLERGPAPLSGALGAVIGGVAAQMQRDNGVDLRCGVRVESLEGDGSGRLRRAFLSDGSTLDVDVAVAALGSIRNVEWLEGSVLAAGDWGVACDAGCRAVDVNGLVTDDVFVAGDVARCPHPVYDYQYLALEHWGNAVAQAGIAAHNMIGTQGERWPHLALPEFWSTQFGTEIKSVGVPTHADHVVIARGSVAERRFVAVYGYRGRITAAVAFNQAKWLEFYAGLIDRAAPFPPSFRTVDQPTDGRPVAAEVPERPTPQATVVVTGHGPSERRATLVRRTYL